MLIKIFILLILAILSSNVSGLNNNDQNVLRRVVCNEGMNSFKNVKCVQETANDPIVIGLHKIMFGYLNGSVNCSETEETRGCEEGMSNIQTPIMLDKGSAQVAMNAVQFPAVGAPDSCKGYDNVPDYMAFNFECLKTSSITEMCSTSTKSGQKLSVYNNGYPAIRSVTGTHHCECQITSPSPLIYITLYDYRLNCTGNQQNLTIDDQHGNVLAPVCDSFQNGQYNSSNQNLTMVWRGQVNTIGLFWVGFQASDPKSNVTVNCYQILDPTTTTTTTTTTATTTPSTTSTVQLLTSSNTSISQNGVPRSNHSSAHSTQSPSLTSTQKMGNTEHQKQAMPKTVIYGLAGGGGFIFIIVIVCVVVVRRRNKANKIDHAKMMGSMSSYTRKPSGQNATRESSTKSQGSITNNRKASTEIEIRPRDDKGRKVSSNNKKKTSGQNTTRESAKAQGSARNNRKASTEIELSPRNEDEKYLIKLWARLIDRENRTSSRIQEQVVNGKETINSSM